MGCGEGSTATPTEKQSGLPSCFKVPIKLFSRHTPITSAFSYLRLAGATENTAHVHPSNAQAPLKGHFIEGLCEHIHSGKVQHA